MLGICLTKTSALICGKVPFLFSSITLQGAFFRDFDFADLLGHFPIVVPSFAMAACQFADYKHYSLRFISQAIFKGKFRRVAN